MVCDGHYQDIKLCNPVPTICCSSGFTVGTMGLITYVISILPSFSAGTILGTQSSLAVFSLTEVCCQFGFIHEYLLTLTFVSELQLSVKKKNMICRCKKSKLNEMSPAFLAMLPFISYMYSALKICSYMFWFFEGKESRQTHILCLACYSHYLNTYIGIIWGLTFFSWSRKQNKGFSK